MQPSAGRRVLMFVRSVLSFRVLMALTTSATVTATVAGPMAYQAAKARDQVEAAAPVTTTVPTTRPPARGTAATVSTTSTTSSTTTTAPTTTVPGEVPASTTTAPPVSATGLFASVYSDHSAPVPLDGTTARFRTWIFVDAPGVTSVTFWVDDPTGSGTPARVATVPFDLDPAGIDLRLTYGLGRHTVLAELTTLDGVSRRSATFDVEG